MTAGATIVLSADRTLTAGYSLLFEGMVAASQTTTTPLPLLAPLLLPGNRGNASLGLRRVEACLRAGGFQPDDVAMVTQKQLAQTIGPQTRLIALSAGEPGGRGMNSSTMSAVMGGHIWPQRAFELLAAAVRRLRPRAHPGVRVLLGGAGAWQLEQDPVLQQQLGIDHVITGYVEKNAADIFRALLDHPASMPRIIRGEWTPQTPIPPVLGPTTFGAVEISRGCGLGCSFCTIAKTPMAHLPLQAIETDVRTNVSAGQVNVSLLSEDLFRYGGDGRRGNPRSLIALLRRLRDIPALRLMQVDHANIGSAAAFTADQLAEVRGLLAVAGQRFVWINIGVESPVGELLKLAGASAKTLGCPPELWGQTCRSELHRLCNAGFLPLVSLLLGIPGQTPEHVQQTLDWVRSFEGKAITFFPVLLAPIDGSQAIAGRDLSPLHWQLIRECYRFNFRWLPQMVWDNQSRGGVPLPKRLILQATGRSQVLLWNSLFAWRQWRSRR